MEVGSLASEVVGVAAGGVFDAAEVFYPVGEFGAAAARETAELVEVVFGVGALLGRGGRAFDVGAPIAVRVGRRRVRGRPARVTERGRRRVRERAGLDRRLR